MFVRNGNVPQGRHVRCQCIPLRDGQGRVIGGMALVKDISAARKHADQGAQAFAAAADDVLGDLVDERHGALEPRTNDAVYGGHIGANEGADFV